MNRAVVGALLTVPALATGCGSAPASTTSSPAATASIGREVHDGNFAFTVTRFDSNLPRIRDHVPNGEYVAVVMTVKNLGSHTETYVSGNQKLKDTAGNVYSTDNTVDAALNEDLGAFGIKSGYQAQMTEVFDVPSGVVPAFVELHDSASSPGTTVDLER
jgi:hypothetical protein